jgi:hypothetical protein
VVELPHYVNLGPKMMGPCPMVVGEVPTKENVQPMMPVLIMAQ